MKVVSSPHIAQVMLLILLESLEVKVIYASKVSLSHSEQKAFSISPTFPVGVNMVMPLPSRLSWPYATRQVGTKDRLELTLHRAIQAIPNNLP